MISKKAFKLLEDSHFSQWGNSWWEGPEYLGEVVKLEDVTGIIEESETEVLELVKEKIINAIPDKSIENLINEIIGELKNEE